ncbi:serine/threonine-protein kinase [Nocardioides sp. MH1]|uniref:serine/threonine-protein kinase n=1 Tax=Nocardioides sp. MH1 TaxID=3242490 RepID=UPI00351FAFE9
MSPEVIAGRYEVLREIGRGGMGAVWLCRDKVLGREVAVKQVGGLPGESAPHLARALREARASAALNLPQVVSIYDAVEDGEHVWLVMEYVPSRTLSTLLADEGPLPARRAAFVGAQVADGLAAAHAGGTVHRDVKPGNILVGDGDLAKISDFGIARHDSDDTLTQTGMVTGTPMFFSPQLARGVRATPADDVWALGATLFTAVEGRPPWPPEPNALAMLVHIAENAPPRPASAGPLTTLIGQMMDPDPAARPDMAAVASVLHTVAAGDVEDPDETEHPTVAFTNGPPTVEREIRAADPPPVPVQRRWLLPAAIVLVLVLVAVGALLLLSDGGDDSSTTAGDSPSGSADGKGAEPAASSAAPDQQSTASTPTPTETTETTDESSTDAAQFVTDYYALLPTDTKSAWALLSDDLQDQVGSYGSYRGFWSTIDSVSVDSATESSDGAVTVDLTYVSDAGTESETRLITVEDTGEGMQIVGDQVT